MKPYKQACNFIKKKTPAQVLSYEFCQILKTLFLKNTPWRLLLKPSLDIVKCEVTMVLLHCVECLLRYSNYVNNKVDVVEINNSIYVIP